MLDAVFAWLSQFDGQVSVHFLPLSKEPNFSLLSLAPAAVSAVASIAATSWFFRKTVAKERIAREETAKELGAARAISGCLKLIQWANILGEVNNHFSKQVRALPADMNNVSKFHSIRPMIGKHAEPEKIRPDEFSFVLKSEFGNLADDVSLAERRAVNLLFLVEKYLNMNGEFDAWIETIPGAKLKAIDGAYDVMIPKEYIPNFEYRASNLEGVLTGILNRLNDLDETTATVRRFIAAGQKIYGPLFSLKELRAVQRGGQPDPAQKSTNT